MTATHAKEESQEDRISNKDFQSIEKLNTQINTQMMKNTTSSTNQSNFDRCFSDQSSSEGSSTEEEYSPKSVEEFGLKRFVHHQVLKIREEDSHIGLIHDLTSQQVRALIFSRPILPSSPLSGKSSIKSFSH